ncbi:MAG: hypothetical protein F7C08_03785 [Desulfurococcales archaeon]|nr:hypothetical protein [Desulfurococcales archaeon]
MKYVMVTHLENHWDKIPNNITSYKIKWIKFELNKENIKDYTPTIFIKLNVNKEPVKAWEGYVYNIKIKNDKVFFNVKLEREIQHIPDEYINYKEGWYIIKEEEINIFNKLIYYPPFFYILSTTEDYKEFELYTYKLLKLLGINNIFRYEKQRGQPDGFFIIKK